MKKEPIRMCAVCREHKPKNELIKVVRTKDGFVGVDLGAKRNGRSVYICLNEACLIKAQKSNLIRRTLDYDDTKIYEEIANAQKLAKD